jgi:hypothetical protein
MLINVSQFNHEQKEAFDKVMDSVNNDRGKIFFLHSAGGCGKTYVCNTIAAAVRAQGKVALCVASSAIAALLLMVVALHIHVSKSHPHPSQFHLQYHNGLRSPQGPQADQTHHMG